MLRPRRKRHTWGDKPFVFLTGQTMHLPTEENVVYSPLSLRGLADGTFSNIPEEAAP